MYIFTIIVESILLSQNHGLVIGWLWVLGYSVMFVIVSSSLVVVGIFQYF